MIIISRAGHENRLARAPFAALTSCPKMSQILSALETLFCPLWKALLTAVCGVTFLTQFGDTTLMWKFDVWNLKSGWRIEGHGVTFTFACRMVQSVMWFLSAAYLMSMSTRFFLESKFVSNLLDSNLWLEISLLLEYCLWCCSKWSHSH